MSKQLFDTDEIECVCANCNVVLVNGDESLRPDDTCVYCYVNELCPDRCNESHPAPEPTADGTWDCPTTGNLYAYQGRADGRFTSGDWVEDRLGAGSILHHNWWCDPDDFYLCDECGRTVHADDLYGYEDYSYCSFCYEDAVQSGEDDSRYDENTGDYLPPVNGGCDRCNNDGRTLTHWHPITENVYCALCAPQQPDVESIDAMTLVGAAA